MNCCESVYRWHYGLRYGWTDDSDRLLVKSEKNEKIIVVDVSIFNPGYRDFRSFMTSQ